MNYKNDRTEEFRNGTVAARFSAKTIFSFVQTLALVGFVSLATPSLSHAQYSSPVRSIDNPARQPVDIELDFHFNLNDIEASANFTVPAGKRLVIEHVSLRATFGQAHRAYGNIVTQRNGSNFHFFKIDLIGPIGSAGQEMIASDLIKIYADPNTDLRVDVTRNTGGDVGNGSVHLSGHYVDLP